MELCKPLPLLILWTYGQLSLCVTAIYITFKLLSTWNYRENTTRNNILFEMTNKLTINFFHHHFTNFNWDKFRDTYYIVIKTCINLSQATMYRHLIMLKQRRLSPGFPQLFSRASLWSLKLFHCGFQIKALVHELEP